MRLQLAEAIHAFRRVTATERLLEKRKIALKLALNDLDQEELAEYVRETTEK